MSRDVAVLPDPRREPRAFLRALFDVAVAAAAPGPAVRAHLPEPPARGRVLVLGAGKAAAAMAQAVEATWLDQIGAERLRGMVVTPEGHGLPLRTIEGLVAGHPVPDARSEAAALRFLEEARRLEADDLLLMLLSGGGSALLAAPAPGLTLADKAEASRALLAAGLPIASINAVRRRLSSIKGGRLALAAAPASVLNLVVSDVPGDDPATVASGPSLPSSSSDEKATFEALPEAARRVLATGEPPPLPGDPRLPPTRTQVVLTATHALAAAERAATAAGCEVLNLGSGIEGEARSVAAEHARRALDLRDRRRGSRPLVILSGGETAVRIAGGGLGGRNTEYLLALAVALDSTPDVHALAADTDGIDGRGGHAGAVLPPDLLQRCAASGLDPVACLEVNDSRSVFERTGDLILTGPTRTNVNDFRVILLAGA